MKKFFKNYWALFAGAVAVGVISMALTYFAEMRRNERIAEAAANNKTLSDLRMSVEDLVKQRADLLDGFSACVQLRENEDKPLIGPDNKLTEFARSYILLEDQVDKVRKKYLKERP